MGMIVELISKAVPSQANQKQPVQNKSAEAHPLQGFALRWYNYPQSTKCFAMIVDDPAQDKDPVYYLGYDIPVGNEVIDHLEALGNSVNFNSHHALRIRVYALKDRTNLPPNTTLEQLRRAMEGRIVAVGEQWLSLNVH